MYSRLIVLGLASLWLTASCGSSAVPTPKEQLRERVQMEGRDYEIRYQPRASEAELGLPFYPKARVLRSRLDQVTHEGKETSLLAVARLTTSDGIEAVVQFYRRELSGHPAPEAAQAEGPKLVTFVSGTRETCARSGSRSGREAGVVRSC